MKAESIQIELRSSSSLYKELVQSLVPFHCSQHKSEKTRTATLLLDFPLTWALRELNSMSIRERAHTVIFTTAASPTYLDTLADYFVSGVIIPTTANKMEAALYSAAFAMRTYSRATDLTPTELRLIRFLLVGKETSDIAEEMRVSPKTVNAHFSNILQKLNLQRRMQIVTEVLRPIPSPA